MTSVGNRECLRFDRFVIDVRDQTLIGPDGPIHIGRKAFQVLMRLVEAQGALITKDALFESVWDGMVISESALTTVIKELRRALGDDSKTPRFIASAYGRGYRFIADVHTVDCDDVRPVTQAGTTERAVGRSVVSLRGPEGVSRRTVLIGSGGAIAAVAGVAAWQYAMNMPGGTQNSIAVMPFTTIGGPDDEAYLAEGISEEIRLELARNPRLKVMARPSVEYAVRKTGDPGKLREMLDVAMLLTGSVRRAGDMLRITADLSDGTTGYTLWADRFDKPVSDIFVVQDDIARQVSGVLDVAMIKPQAIPAARDPANGGTANVEAYDAFLRGNAYFNNPANETVLRAAKAQFAAAVEADPGFARASGQLAMTIMGLAQNYDAGAQFSANVAEALRLAKSAVAKAPRYAPLHIVAGYVLVQGMLDIGRARRWFESARTLGPGDPYVLANYAAFAAQTGQKDAASAALANAIAVNPLDARLRLTGAYVSLLNRQFDMVADSSAQAIAMDNGIAFARGWAGDALIAAGRFEAARANYDREPFELIKATGLAIAHFHLGNKAQAQVERDRVVGEFAVSSAYQQAQIAAQWGEMDHAAALLERALAIGDSGMGSAFRDPLLDPIRGNPRSIAVLKRMGFV